MSKSTIADVRNMINNYSGSQEERDTIIKAVRPMARCVANKHLNKPLIKIFHTLDDLEMLIYLHVLKMLQKRKKIPCRCKLESVLYWGLIDQLRAEEKRIKRDPKTAEYPLDIFEYGDNYILDYIDTDFIDFLDDLDRCNSETYKADIFSIFKAMFFDFVYLHKDLESISKRYGYTPCTALNYMLSVAKTLCGLYGSDYQTVKDMIINYRDNIRAPKERCRYGRLMDCKMLSVPAYHNRE